jgi:hypothetical protein
MNPRYALALVLVGIVGVCLWFVAGKPDAAPSTPEVTSIDLPSPPPLVAPSPVPLPTPAGDVAPSVRTRAPTSPDGAEIIPEIPLETGELPWEATIRKTLADDKASDAEKGRRILEMIPTMAVEGRSLVVLRRLF